MPRVLKYDSNTASRIIELASLGYGVTASAKLLGVTRNTLHRWIKRNDLTERMRTAENDYMKSTIKRGLVALSEGAKATETIRESIETCETTGKVTKVTEKIRTLPPNEKAIQILAQSYAKVFSKTEIEEINKSLNINLINTSEMTLRELQAIPSPLGAISVDATCEEVVDSGDLGPPEEDSE